MVYRSGIVLIRQEGKPQVIYQNEATSVHSASRSQARLSSNCTMTTNSLLVHRSVKANHISIIDDIPYSIVQLDRKCCSSHRMGTITNNTNTSGLVHVSAYSYAKFPTATCHYCSMECCIGSCQSRLFSVSS